LPARVLQSSKGFSIYRLTSHEIMIKKTNSYNALSGGAAIAGATAAAAAASEVANWSRRHPTKSLGVNAAFCPQLGLSSRGVSCGFKRANGSSCFVKPENVASFSHLFSSDQEDFRDGKRSTGSACVPLQASHLLPVIPLGAPVHFAKPTKSDRSRLPGRSTGTGPFKPQVRIKNNTIYGKYLPSVSNQMLNCFRGLALEQ